MKMLRSTIALAILAGLACGAAAQPTTTREQVREELLEAIRTGDVMAPGDSGLKLNELYPQRYGKRLPVGSITTRAEVKAEFAAARLSHELIPAGEGTLPSGDEARFRDSLVAASPAKTREEVKAETLAAIREGDVFPAGEAERTLGDRYPQRYARQRARDGHFMASAPATDRSGL